MNGFHNVNNLGSLATQQMMTNRVEVVITNWENGSINDLTSFLSRQSRIAVRDVRVEGNAAIGYVANKKEAEALNKFNGIRFAGKSLKIQVTGGVDNSSPTVKLLKAFLFRRYDPQTKMLNLGSIHTDAELVQKGLFTTISTQSKMFAAMMKLASSESNLVVESVNLSDNNLKDINGITTLAQTFPNLKNLCLANNQIARYKSMEPWKNKFKKLRELLMTNNPIVNERAYKNEMLKIFPKLVMLDNIVVRDAQKLDAIYNFPFKSKPFFFENNELGSSSTEFVTNFLNLWDSDRSQLLQLYTPQSQFSMCSDASVPPSSVKDADQNPSFGFYLSSSRNITKISTDTSIQQKLATGPEGIAEIFNSLPMTKHYLLEKAESYSMQTISYGQVNGFMIILHGFFEETTKPMNVNNKGRPRRFNHGSNASSDKRLSKKSFDRVWVLVPTNYGVIVASDMLTVRPYVSAAWIKVPDTPATINNTAVPMQQMNQPNFVPNTTMNQQMSPPILAPTLQLPPEIQARLSPIQLELLNKLHVDTKLNSEYTYMLAEQSGWNYDVAFKGFQSSMGQIPREAYIQ
ncbi:hypothetical protein TPHA_0D01390 [Tetrapisispora phaffii CBS 4417]|uniref:mRNA export factor MEX67 n=1 Tax=Tetrapisispora phaffii (strain ATCC 24235 / CBS 4417 / NBRC 1672 / NRRL Y-8282 / UCD 70-5) TaxID=1071381 RepID=G8BSF9_TETPH|nr:hypothetical protein TPHA_0D01390 [Tetrapisispora phaffii CBS 4417]CCE62780.1 hypothetical protein TPHA_0D01390 [Tetrapisispora phaffii CBS 4417]